MELIANKFPLEAEDCQARTVIVKVQSPYGEVVVINGYFPQGESRRHPVKFPAKEKYYQHLMAYLQSLPANQPVVVMGDFNIAPDDKDVGITNAADWLKRGSCSFLPEERAWYAHLYDLGLVDSWRLLNPEQDGLFSWFDYRTRAFERTEKRGLRIDHILLSASLTPHLVDAGMDYAIRGMEKPSDHVPIWCQLGQSHG